MRRRKAADSDQTIRDPVRAAIYNPKEFRGRPAERDDIAAIGRERNGASARKLLWFVASTVVAMSAWVYLDPSRRSGPDFIQFQSTDSGHTSINDGDGHQAKISSTEQDQRNFIIQMTGNRYLAQGAINGKPVSYVVDPNSRHILVPTQLAERAGIGCIELGTVAIGNYQVNSCRGIAREVAFGPFRLSNAEVVVLGDANEIVLGAGALHSFHVRIRESTMQITPKP